MELCREEVQVGRWRRVRSTKELRGISLREVIEVNLNEAK